MTENDKINPDEPLNDLQALKWQLAMGVDEAVGEQSADWFERSAASKIASSAKTATADVPAKKASVVANVPSDTGFRLPGSKPANAPSAAKPVDASQDNIGDARKLAAGCQTIDDLVAALQSFTACPLSRTATNLCFIDGNREAKILLIGEAPGRDEDLQGKPFVGRSGQLLDKMISHIGLSRAETDPGKSVLISNTVFWRPPGNRKPTESEMLMCLPFVNKLIALTKPEIIVCLGATPTQRLTGETKGITRLRGRWFDYRISNDDGHGIPLLATLHPSYLLRQPAQKRLAWRDLVALKKRSENVNDV